VRIGCADSRAIPQAYNRYTYCLNNPVRYSDPSGHWIPVEDATQGWMNAPARPPLAVRYAPAGYLQIIQGGRYHVNPYERSIANYLLSGGVRAPLGLENGGFSQLMGRTITSVASQYGYGPQDEIEGLPLLGVELAAIGVGRIASERPDPVALYDVGTYAELSRRSVKGDELEIHHVPSKHPAAQTVPGYNARNAPSIMLRREAHLTVPTHQGVYLGTARDLLAGDVWELHKRGVPNESLQMLIDMNMAMYPGAMSK